ncbi:unnamed protein product [Didymodactylos carnosus]|nr:unnamed protein product [Didymodactylos carnosus]CAF3625944.1 unnamed protein product [Didymodactylos carnosus]
MTLANWGCGIDLALGTYIPSDLVGRERYDIIKGEEELRLAMKDYAINDCFATTRLMYLVIYKWSREQVNNYQQSLEQLLSQCTLAQQSMEYEPISDDELAVVHVRDERPSVVEDLPDDNEEQQPLVHVEYEPRTPLTHQLFTGELSIHVDEPLTPLFLHSPPHRHSSSSTTRVPESSSHSSSTTRVPESSSHSSSHHHQHLVPYTLNHHQIVHPPHPHLVQYPLNHHPIDHH